VAESVAVVLIVTEVTPLVVDTDITPEPEAIALEADTEDPGVVKDEAYELSTVITLEPLTVVATIPEATLSSSVKPVTYVGTAVGDTVGASVGATVAKVGAGVGLPGAKVGSPVGCPEGLPLG